MFGARADIRIEAERIGGRPIKPGVCLQVRSHALRCFTGELI